MSERLVAVAQLGHPGAGWRCGPHSAAGGYEGLQLYKSLRGRLRRARDMVEARRIYVFDWQGRFLLDTEPDVPIGRVYVRLRLDRAELASVWQGKPSHSVGFQDENVAVAGRPEWLEVLWEKGFSLVITNYKMEPMDGLEVLRVVRQEWPDTDVVLITTYGTVEIAVETMKGGTSDFITKLFLPDALRLNIYKILVYNDIRRYNERLNE